MIEVIKPGKYKIGRYRYTCAQCLCEFEYSWGDIGTTAIEKCGKIEFDLGIQCPCCKTFYSAAELNYGSTQLEKFYSETNGKWDVEIEKEEVDRLHNAINESIKKMDYENNR